MGGEAEGLSKNEHNFMGGVWASVTKRYMVVGGLLKPQKNKRDVLYGLCVSVPMQFPYNSQQVDKGPVKH